ncbi:MAG: DUF4433 domain-containing protein [Planctomycetaceae bacterium]|jgi:hypothetical protein|nr:DUF4433 domain-containing protein [Planctomycetaceae bacterium]
MGRIKQRRLERIEVTCHPGTTVGEYVPFYFCPRSVMLYILHMGNNADLEYRGGQSPIVHLQADLHASIAWARTNAVRWACSDRNASAYVASFVSRAEDLTAINWPAIASSDFRNPVTKEGKQAEFLMHTAFPWSLVEAVGVYDQQRLALAETAIARAVHRPRLAVRPDWYY